MRILPSKSEKIYFFDFHKVCCTNPPQMNKSLLSIKPYIAERIVFKGGTWWKSQYYLSLYFRKG
jgi:hypothetical protein